MSSGLEIMPIRNLTLGLGIVLSVPALGQTHGNASHGSHSTSRKALGHRSSSITTYSVQNGDFDWAIAHKHGIRVAQLHSMNPGVNWSNLQVGIHLHVPGRVSAQSVTEHKPSSIQAYRVKQGDFDWIIAHRNGISLSALKALNPEVNLAHLHPGEQIVLAGGSRSEASHSRIRTRYAVIAADAVRIHRKEAIHSSAITTVDRGTHVKILDRDGEWYRLRFPKGTEGWVKVDFLKPIADNEESTHHSRRRHHSSYYTSRRHRHGHSSEPEVAINTKALKGDRLLSKAASYQGVRYVWGGMSRSGTDCSGFTSQVYRSQGIKLPRTSREQSGIGQHVKKGELQPGDLVFFHTGRGKRINHVGIYMGGNKFIHASSGGHKVRVSELSGFYANRFATARRVVHKHASKTSHSSSAR